MSIKSRFCPECGNETDNLIESLCVSCYSNQPIVKLPKQKNVLFCVKCEQVLNKGFWMKGMKSAEQILEERVQNSLVLPSEETLVSAKILEFGKEGILKVASKRNGEMLTREVEGKFEIKKYCCPACSRESGVDYLAKLQLRSTKNPQNFVEESLKYIKFSNPKIAKVDNVLHGADVYLVNAQIARRAARRIKKHFDCSIKSSYRNYGWDKEKDRPKRRITILLKQK